MTILGTDRLQGLPTKNWQLRDVQDLIDAHCAACGARIRWGYFLAHTQHRLVVGSECVRSLTTTCDPKIAFALLHGKWHQRRRYLYKRVRGRVYIVGPSSRGEGAWYTAESDSLTMQSWWNFGPDYMSLDCAKRALACRYSMR